MGMLYVRELMCNTELIGYRLTLGKMHGDVSVDLLDDVSFMLLEYRCAVLSELQGRFVDDVYYTGCDSNATELESLSGIRDFLESNGATRIYDESDRLNSVLSSRYIICRQMLLSIGIPLGRVTSIVVNSRLSSSWGRCLRSKSTGTYSIDVADRLLQSGTIDGIDSVIIHELIHTCPDCLNHKSTWKYWIRVVCDYYGYDIKRLSSADELGVDIDVLLEMGYYACQCVDCGKVLGYKTECQFILYPYLYSCSCGGKFTRIQ